ncbi:hypothetical protein [Sphingomonas baiyangensis]|uniref:Uncharacterized protein n=1 Tax=Sphingomonas baiyangensis TaxID=2572576 RepID=A0A4U1L1X7_9SPHN|nr:hypothetical protein [Sphingomonas baiyangensis]TKD50582.1 hypothetical protein FBR43_07235 [Sphingomonas baiyangensis]
MIGTRFNRQRTPDGMQINPLPPAPAQPQPQVPAFGAAGGELPGRGTIPAGAISPEPEKPRGFFNKVGAYLKEPGVGAALFRSGAETLRNGFGSGLAAAAGYMDNRNEEQRIAQQWQQGFALQQDRAQREFEKQNAEAQRAAMDRRTDLQGRAAATLMGVDDPEAMRSSLEPFRAAFEAEGLSIDSFDTSPQSLAAMAAMSRSPDQILGDHRINWMPIAPGATIQGFSGPRNIPLPSGAGRSGGAAPARITSEREMRELPPGAEFIAPDGSRRRVPGGGATPAGSRTFR